MIRIGIIGLGKMGLSHFSVFNSHPDVKIVGICDTSNLMISTFGKYTNIDCFNLFDEMIEKAKPDGVVIATPTISHTDIIEFALERKIHVFVEKPLCIQLEEGKKMVAKANQLGIVNQVGYHLRFVSTFNETKRLLDNGVIGKIYQFNVETYGPVVLKTKGVTWREKKSEGGGCLYDYASHAINLINYFFGLPKKVGGTVFKKIYSKDAEDAVYSTLFYDDELTGQLAVNWSDESYRKMTNRITLLGHLGKLVVDRQECRIFFRNKNRFENLTTGWNIKYTTELTKPVWFYLRGEEYSAQVDYFINHIKIGKTENINSFASGLETDMVINLLINNSSLQNE